MIIECKCTNAVQDAKYGKRNRKFVKIGEDPIFTVYECSSCGHQMIEVPKFYFKTTKQLDGTKLFEAYIKPLDKNGRLVQETKANE